MLDPARTRITLCNIPLGSNATLADRDYCCDDKEKGRCCGNPDNHFHIDGEGSRTPQDRSKARNRLSLTAIKTFATLAAATRPYEPDSESIDPPSALSTIQVTITYSAPDSSTSTLDTPLSTSQSEAGASSTCTTTCVTTEPKSTQAPPSNLSGGSKIGITVGVSVGMIIVIIALMCLGYRRARRGRYGRRLLSGQHSADEGRYSAEEGRNGTDKRRLQVTKDQIGLPTLVVDESRIPEDFRKRPNHMSVSIGLAIEMNSARHLSPNSLAQPNSAKSPKNFPGTPLSVSFPPRAKTGPGPNYHSIPSSPTSPFAVSPSFQHTGQPVPTTESSRTQSSPPWGSLDPRHTPLPPAAKLGDAFQKSLRRSSVYFRTHHHQPLASSPEHAASIELLSLRPDDDEADSSEQYPSLLPK